MSTLRWAATTQLEHPDHPRSEEALEAASYILWALSGRRFSGVKRVTEIYSTSQALARGSSVYPTMRNGKFYNVSSECCCSGCGVFHRIRLRSTPVRRVIEVQVDGRVLDRSEYVILDHGILGFLTSDVCGMECVVITYLYGSIPPGGEEAAIKLANELVAAAEGQECALPQRVTSVSRQGVSWTLLDPQDFLNDRRTGIYEIDLLLAALNPVKALMRPRVFSPDLPRAETWTSAPPPPAAVISEGDQAIILGHESTWIVDDVRARELVDAGQWLTTLIGSVARPRQWFPVQGSDISINTVLSPEETFTTENGDSWAVYSESGYVLSEGTIRVI